ncbi:MAG: amidohydrolase [Oscillospiraceae bacterium]|nr:amidohydrolase [Oscillospiraceae bacterium]
MRILIKDIDVIKSADSEVMRGADIGIEDGRILFVNCSDNMCAAGDAAGAMRGQGNQDAAVTDAKQQRGQGSPGAGAVTANQQREQGSPGVQNGFVPDKVINGCRKLAIPGLVNAHCHSAMTLLRGFADDLELETWLFDNIIPAESKLAPDDVYWGTQLGIIEMIKNGTTCFNDMYLNMDEVGRAVYESGIRASISIGPLLSGKRGDALVDVEGCRAFFNKWDKKDGGRIRTNIEIHSMYMYTPETLRAGAELAKELNSPIHIHMLETATERKNILEQFGKSSIELALEFGLLDVGVIAAHCVHVSEADISIMVNKGVNAVHNPTSNLKLASGIAPVKEMIAAGVNVCLGTDGVASNNVLNMFKEMHLAALIHKGVRGDPTLILAGEAFRMATENGAKAIGFSDSGVIGPGRAADIVIIDMDKPHLTPLHNHMSTLVYSVGGHDVDTVIVDGDILMESREMLTIDEEKVKNMVRRISESRFRS